MRIGCNEEGGHGTGELRWLTLGLRRKREWRAEIDFERDLSLRLGWVLVGAEDDKLPKTSSGGTVSPKVRVSFAILFRRRSASDWRAEVSVLPMSTLKDGESGESGSSKRWDLGG